MELAKYLIDIILHVDVHLSTLIEGTGIWVYLILFAIIFCETGLVITPFLPGDSLLFAVGTFAAIGVLDPLWLFCLLTGAAILGDSFNFAIGNAIGHTIVRHAGNRFLRKEHLDRTHRFYEKHGGKTIILARFIPIIRTFAPFVAGIGSMQYSRFLLFNISGALLWIGLLGGAGYFFGNIPFVRQHFSIVILAIIIISCLPGVIEYLRQRKKTTAP
ncbi:MAG: hypothetical protein A2521_11675 [Deltaproteobacteria bacterium RIFOXYD12_FULL_57_12]|nr:MAG: hypothetical protein A2521_11675 [Deltaproteobacteria bacterium RIFOXYD12_FULL_57_12]